MPTPTDFAAYGRIGVAIRNRRLSAEERSRSAQHAARARWKGISKSARSEAARKAVQARWAAYRARQKHRRAAS